MSQQLNSIAVIGVGLMGGSIGLAALSRQVCGEVVGIGRNEQRLAQAMELGAITRSTTDLAEGVEQADVVVICTPVGTVVDQARQVFDIVGSEAIITDVASTKREIMAALQPQVAEGMQFVGSHPLCGSHRSGVDASDSDLYHGEKIIVSPARTLPLNEDAKYLVRQIVFFWKALGGIPIEMTPESHDDALAATSHVPHAIASILAAATPPEFLSLVASGWKDTTRVAAGSIHIWQDIIRQNKAGVIKSLDQFGTVFDEFRTALENENWQQIASLLEQGKNQRDAVGN